MTMQEQNKQEPVIEDLTVNEADANAVKGGPIFTVKNTSRPPGDSPEM